MTQVAWATAAAASDRKTNLEEGARDERASGMLDMSPRQAGKATIFVVDDDDDVREAVSSALDEEGYQVLVATDGEGALSLLRGVPAPDLILLDLTMPRMTGAELRQRLQTELPVLDAVPVVVMSADVEGRAKARALGATDFLRKPIRLHELFRAVAAHLRRRADEPEA